MQLNLYAKMRICFPVELSLKEISYVVHVHALVQGPLYTPAVMMRNSCALGMRNAFQRKFNR